MVIAGAKGFAKEVLEVLYQINPDAEIAFYDDLSTDLPCRLYGRYEVLKTIEEVEAHFKSDNRFVLGTGNPKIRYLLSNKLMAAGGVLSSIMSPKAVIGNFGNTIGPGCNIMSGCVLTSDIEIGEGVLINLNCTIGHDVKISDYCELSPGVHISGHVELGKNCVIGTGAVILPGVKIGDNSIIGAGSVVNKNIESNLLAVGVPAKVIKHL